MIQIFHDSRAAARILAKGFGGRQSQSFWSQFLRSERAVHRAGSDYWIPFETAANGKPVYSEGNLYRFIYEQRPRRLAAARKAKSQSRYQAFTRASYERAGELGVALSGPGINPAETWISREQAIELALELLLKARYIAGRRLDVATDEVHSIPGETLVADEVFDRERGEHVTTTQDDAELEHVLDWLSRTVAPSGGHHGP